MNNPCRFDLATGEWQDGETVFLRWALWRESGENADASLTCGIRGVVVGRLKQRSFDTDDGEIRPSPRQAQMPP